MNTYTLIKYSIYDKSYIEKQIISIKNYKNSKKIEFNSIIKYEQKTKNSKEEIIDITSHMQTGSNLIVANLAVLGRYTDVIYDTILYLLNKNITIIAVDDKYELTKDDKFTKFILKLYKHAVDIEKELSSHRTKEALYYKKLSGQKLGKPIGTVQKSKFDKDLNKIQGYLRSGQSIRQISKLLGFNNHIGLNNYIKKRGIRKSL